MVAATSNPSLEGETPSVGVNAPTRKAAEPSNPDALKTSSRKSLENLLAFSALREQVLRKRANRAPQAALAPPAFTVIAEDVHFSLEELLQVIVDRAFTVTEADGVAIALAENEGIILRAASGTVRPDMDARLNRDSAFSRNCFQLAEVEKCEDAETDSRVDREACRQLGARSMVAVPLRGQTRGIGLLEAFSTRPFAFSEEHVGYLNSLADLLVGALTPEDLERYSESARVAAATLENDSNESESVSVAGGHGRTQHPVSTEAALAIAKKLLEEDADREIASPPPIEAVSEALHSAQKYPFHEYGSAISATAVSRTEKLSRKKESLSRRKHWFAVLACLLLVGATATGLWFKRKAARSAPTTVQTGTSIPTRSVSGDTGGIANPGNGDGALTSPASTGDSPADSHKASNPATVTAIEHWSSDETSTVVLELEDQVQYEAHRLESPDRIYFDLHDTELAPSLDGKSIVIGDGLLSRIRIAQPVAGITRVVLETKTHPDFSVSLQPNPYRLVIEVHKLRSSPPKGAVNLITNAIEAEKNNLPILVPPATKEDLDLRGRVPKMRIVVDAGHGGRDHGTVGRNGLLEKDLVLEIAQRLGKLLQERLGADVIYTRQEDNYVALDERARIANQSQADLFVSIHANYSDLPSARGVETYYTNFFMVPVAKDVETSTGAASASNPEPSSLSPADLRERVGQSQRLAASVQRSMYEALAAQNPGLRDRGIREANFVVLTESAMPGILAEVSFVSSPTDEQKLRSDGYREQVAEALYKGIALYAASSRPVKVASAGR
jgi:N-acetylmuramoyl-L-alanine amidase